MARIFYKNIFRTVSLARKNTYNSCKIKINLQLFADPDKTEQPTPRKLQKAREEGNIPQSKEFNMAVTFLSLSALLLIFSGTIATDLSNILRDYLSLNVDKVDINILSYGLLKHTDLWVKVMMFFVVAALISLLLGMIQTQFLFTFKSLKFDLSKIDPIKGFKNLFSLKSFMEFLKNLIKIIIAGYFGYSIYIEKQPYISKLASVPVLEGVRFISNMIIEVLFKMGLALLILSLFDFWFQRFDYKRNLKMSKKEIKDESKDIEGNPEIKKKQREFMMKIVMSRMMQQVPSSDVIITNPTHYAVAIKYDAEKMSAPKVVAKGVDEVAFRIRDIASENYIPIVQKPPLARELYATTEINEEIPDNLYKAVAEVLAYVYNQTK
ncbi:flagellar biosynthesis protein FlhB [Tepiditoga spiralis]|uniref:Flagellar biosynthetic protein FlhB n=1 Tax=Tepiditoga spiralis TaxID=2108365 RepID=A0A7G1GAQ8_9BACT|nr:flagellar biosynthesis protein FlhB [Tepiditoga spiralis]BBE31302.1 flagellar biosynthesis protein FlhB [Tepiditoga spiralis]